MPRPERAIPPLHVVTDDRVCAAGGFLGQAIEILGVGSSVAFHLRAPRAIKREASEFYFCSAHLSSLRSERFGRNALRLARIGRTLACHRRCRLFRNGRLLSARRRREPKAYDGCDQVFRAHEPPHLELMIG